MHSGGLPRRRYFVRQSAGDGSLRGSRAAVRPAHICAGTGPTPAHICAGHAGAMAEQLSEDSVCARTRILVMCRDLGHLGTFLRTAVLRRTLLRVALRCASPALVGGASWRRCIVAALHRGGVASALNHRWSTHWYLDRRRATPADLAAEFARVARRAHLRVLASAHQRSAAQRCTHTRSLIHGGGWR